MSEDKLNDDIIDVEPTIITEPKPEPVSPPKRDMRRILAAGVALGLVCAVLGGWFYRGMLASYLPTDQMQALNTRVDTLEVANKDATKRVDAVIALTDELKAKLGAAQAEADKSAKSSLESSSLAQSMSTTVTELKQALDDEKASLESLQAKIGNSASTSVAIDPALTARLDSLEKTIGALQSAPAAVAQPNIASLQQAVDALKAKVASGQGFSQEASAVEKLLPAAEGFDVLNAEAAKGMPNADALLQSLNTIRQALPKAAAPSPSGGWLDSIGGWFSNLVSVKPMGGDDIATVAAKAGAFLASGDLQQAVDSLSTATAPLPGELKNWRDMAQRRLKLEQALSRISAAAAREIASKG